MSLSNEQLSYLIQTLSKHVDNGGIPALLGAANELIKVGILPNMHVGRGDGMDDSTEYAVRLKLEWFAGQLVKMSDGVGDYVGVNCWINCTEKFTKIKLRSEE